MRKPSVAMPPGVSCRGWIIGPVSVVSPCAVSASAGISGALSGVGAGVGAPPVRAPSRLATALARLAPQLCVRRTNVEPFPPLAFSSGVLAANQPPSRPLYWPMARMDSRLLPDSPPVSRTVSAPTPSVV